MRPLHILYFIQHFTRPETTTESHPYQLALRWLEKGHKVTVVTSGPKAPQRHKDTESSAPRRPGASVAGLTQMILPAELSDRFRIICVRTFNGRGQVLSGPLFVVAGFLRGLFMGRVDVIYSSWTPWTAALPGYFLSFFTRRPLYYEIIGQAAAHEWIERWLYRRADKIIALTERAQQRLEKFGKRSDEILRVANGWEGWGLKQKKGAQSRFLLRRNEQFICIYVGAHEKRNKLEKTILECASHLKGRNVRFLLIGEGGEKDRLQRQAMSLDLDNVRFCNPMSRRKVLACLARSNVALICSEEHVFQKMVLPPKVFDYMLAGCPIVAAARGEVVELIERAECGWWVQPGRAKELADLIDTLRHIDPNELRKKGARGRDFLLRYCLRRDLADKLEETFLQAC